MIDIKCIHYTDTTWHLAPIHVTNSHHSKPVGGLWASPITSTSGWADWCRSEGYRLEGLAVGVNLIISLERAIVIGSDTDLHQLDWDGDYPDWERMVERGVDVVYLTSEGLLATKYRLYGWDCESLVVLHTRAIVTSH